MMRLARLLPGRRTRFRVPAERHPQILVSAQNVWYTQPAVGVTIGPDSVVTISESVFLAIGAQEAPDYASWLSKTQTEVENRLQQFLDNNPDISGNTTGIVVIDHEDPHPQNFHLSYGTEIPATEAEQDAQIEGYKRRIAATRVKFPKAKLALYAIMIADSRGLATEDTLANQAALIRAGQKGMFDQLDYVVPVMYTRFGPADGVHWNKVGPYTTQAINLSRAFLRSNNSNISILPFLSTHVTNGNSNDDETMLLDLADPDPVGHTLGTQMRILASAGVAKVVLWVSRDEDPLRVGPVPNPNGWRLRDYIGRMRTL